MHNLYEYQVSEAEYQKHQTEISSELSRRAVAGVYELHVPLHLRLTISLGSVWTVTKKVFLMQFRLLYVFTNN